MILRVASCAAVSLLLLAACGRRATQADCTAIVDRNVEVQMREMNVTDPDAIKKRQEEIRAELNAQLKDCIGKRVTERMMDCVKHAESAKAIDDCMH